LASSFSKFQEDTYLYPGFDEAVRQRGTLDAIEKASAEGLRLKINRPPSAFRAALTP